MTPPTVDVASRTVTLGGLRQHYQVTAAGNDKATLAADLTRLLEHLGIDGAVSVVGHDMGAGVAHAFAAAHPDRVRRLVFAEFVLPGFGFTEAAAPAPDHENWQLGFFASAPDVAERLFTGRERDLVTWYLGHGAANPDAVALDDLEHYVRQLTRPGALHATVAYFAATWVDAEHNRAAAERPLPMPVLALGGARSAGTGAAASVAQAAAHVETVVVEDAGHWLVDEQPATTTAAIIRFLES